MAGGMARRMTARKSPDETSNEIRSLVQRRRLQLLVHSAVYYAYNESIVTDEQWKKWALELEELQNQYPDIAAQVCYHDAFIGFDHSTGYDLPFRDPEIMSKARQLLRFHDRMRESP